MIRLLAVMTVILIGALAFTSMKGVMQGLSQQRAATEAAMQLTN